MCRKVLSQKIKIKKLVYTCLDFVGKVCFQRTHSKKNELLKIITTIITTSTVEGYPNTDNSPLKTILKKLSVKTISKKNFNEPLPNSLIISFGAISGMSTLISSLRCLL